MRQILRTSLDHPQRKADDEGRTLTFSGACCSHRAAVHFNKALHDGKTQPEAAVLALRRTVGLRETGEQVRKEVRADALPGVGNADLHIGVREPSHDLHRAALVGEFDGIGQEVPQDLLKPAGIAADGTGVGVDHSFQPDVFRIGGRLHRFDGRVDDFRHVDSLDVEPYFS